MTRRKRDRKSEVEEEEEEEEGTTKNKVGQKSKKQAYGPIVLTKVSWKKYICSFAFKYGKRILPEKKGRKIRDD